MWFNWQTISFSPIFFFPVLVATGLEPFHLGSWVNSFTAALLLLVRQQNSCVKCDCQFIKIKSWWHLKILTTFCDLSIYALVTIRKWNKECFQYGSFIGFLISDSNEKGFNWTQLIGGNNNKKLQPTIFYLFSSLYVGCIHIVTAHCCKTFLPVIWLLHICKSWTSPC